jgi:hypothetical protein
MGIVLVAFFAAEAAFPPATTITLTFTRTSSATLSESPLNDNVFSLHVAVWLYSPMDKVNEHFKTCGVTIRIENDTRILNSLSACNYYKNKFFFFALPLLCQ